MLRCGSLLGRHEAATRTERCGFRRYGHDLYVVDFSVCIYELFAEGWNLSRRCAVVEA
ncbi:hypothetical protein H4W31_000068 [Plantactinospora soyae]|uniref:Uncharacterized protein n=1 Tax=Plantactinospora soyae TaxID=1544732 RepID=A0A927M037_9ACTN|nr:hypothetical protein [Plantactinospora soyae]